jgi:ferric-dicitrate binding protein FerR (iron transport regulator)
MSRTHSNAVTSEAVRWFHRFRVTGPTALSLDESAEWARWSADKAHLAEFQRTEQLWDELQHLGRTNRPTQQDLDTDDYTGDRSVSDWLLETNTKGRIADP